ncbi:hypothetical protein BJY52DRAFT_1282378 [Lactarius psammicola]|nr:hypothetical protein BJY52DRAFT_1282378 [Lactarius psammicola]
MRDSRDSGDWVDTSGLSDDPNLVALQDAQGRPVQLKERQKRKTPKKTYGNKSKTLCSRDSVVPPPPAESPRLLGLNYLILGDSPSNIFSVRIEETEYAGTLRGTTKDKNKNTLQHIGPKALKLWNVSIAVDNHFEERINELKGTKPLLPMRLSGVFLKVKHLHIVVRSPSDCQYVMF